jgi:hypothetical protein
VSHKTTLSFESFVVGFNLLFSLLSEKLVTGYLICVPIAARVHTCFPVFVLTAYVLVFYRTGFGKCNAVLFRKLFKLIASRFGSLRELVAAYGMGLCKSFGIF